MLRHKNIKKPKVVSFVGTEIGNKFEIQIDSNCQHITETITRQLQLFNTFVNGTINNLLWQKNT